MEQSTDVLREDKHPPLNASATDAALSFQRLHSDEVISPRMLLKKTGLLLFAVTSFFVVSYLIATILGAQSPHIIHYPPLLIVLMIAFSLGMLITSLWEAAHWVQPIMLLTIMPLPLLSHIASIYSAFAFAAAVIELYRLEYFKRWAGIKISILIGYYALSIVLIGITARIPLQELFTPIALVIAFFMFVTLAFRDRFHLLVTTRRPVLSLSEFHLAKTELLYLKALLQRLSVKEIAALYGVSDSTVRNTLARVYRKFEVPDMAALLAKLSEFDIID